MKDWQIDLLLEELYREKSEYEEKVKEIDLSEFQVQWYYGAMFGVKSAIMRLESMKKIDR